MAVRVHGTTVRAVRTSVFAFFVLFTLFYFELAFQNVLWILSYEENTPSRSWRNFKKI